MVIQSDCYGTVTGVIISSLVIIIAAQYFIPNAWIKWVVTALMVAFSLFIVYFFRVPDRAFEHEGNVLASVADGKVVIIEKTFEKEYLQKECIQVSVYMNFFDVHTNFWPSDGEVTYHKYHPGKYLLAFLPKSSELNEHYSVGFRNSETGDEILFKQIAGTFARRIVNYADKSTTVSGGDQCGVIKFGSRLDMFLPLDAEILVNVGDKVEAVSTPIAILH